MRKYWRNFIGFIGMLVIFWPGVIMASGEKVSGVVIVADTRRLSGLLGWWGSLYNESHAMFTLLTIVLIPIIGVIFGVLADVVMSHIGIDLKSRELAEH